MAGNNSALGVGISSLWCSIYMHAHRQANENNPLWDMAPTRMSIRISRVLGCWLFSLISKTAYRMTSWYRHVLSHPLPTVQRTCGQRWLPSQNETKYIIQRTILSTLLDIHPERALWQYTSHVFRINRLVGALFLLTDIGRDMGRDK